MKPKIKKRKEDPKTKNGKPIYRVFLEDELLGEVHFWQTVSYGGDRWVAILPDGREAKEVSSSGHPHCYQRGGAVSALVDHHRDEKAKAHREAMLKGIGIEIIDGQYTFEGERILHMVQQGNTSYTDQALTHRDLRYRGRDDWQGVTMEGLMLSGFPGEIALLNAAVKMLNVEPSQAVKSYNEDVSSIWRIHETVLPTGLEFQVGHTKDRAFRSPIEAIRFVRFEVAGLLQKIDEGMEAVINEVLEKVSNGS